LEKVGFYVETHTDSQNAIDRLAEEKFDVVVTDIKMKGPDGLDILTSSSSNPPPPTSSSSPASPPWIQPERP
jgi:CheY-like chemotaxis protein